MSNTKYQIEFSKFCKVYARQNQKINLIHLHIHLVETIALITLIYTKKYTTCT